MNTEYTIQQLLEKLHSSDQAERLHAIQTLATRRSLRAVKPLVQAHMRRSTAEQDAIIDCLRQMGELALPPLNTIFLKDVNPAMQAHAAYLLGELGYAESVRVLTRGVAMPNELVRAMAVAALNKFEDDNSYVAFLAALQDPANSVRIEAALALGRRGDVRAVATLLRIVQHRLVLPRHLPLVVEALAATDDPRALEAIYDVYCDSEPVVRLATITALGTMHSPDPRRLTVLREATHDPDATVAFEAQRWLDTLTGEG